MDWIDPRHASANPGVAGARRNRRKKKKSTGGKEVKKGDLKTKPLAAQVTAALSQPIEVWGAAYEHGLAQMKWPAGCNTESTFLWSAVIQEQAEVLVRAGMSANKLAAIVADGDAGNKADQSDRLSEVTGLMEQSLESVAFGWCDTADAYADSALGLAALGWHLPVQARRTGNGWVTQWLQAVMDRLDGYQPDLEAPVLCHLVLQCELPLLVAVAMSASRRTALTEASDSMDDLAEYLERSLDQPGPWLAHGATYLRASLASAFRCRLLASTLGLRKWFPPQQKAWSGLLKHAARWCRPDGTQLLAAGNSPPRAKAIWDALARQTKRPKSMTAAMTLAGIGSGKRAEVKKSVSPAHLPALSYYSEEASSACMQTDWRQKGSRVAIDFSDAEICLEALGPKGQSIFSGQWTCGVELDGQSQMQLDEWAEVCWFSDDDVDYLELEAKFGKHACVQRQAVLLRDEKLLLLADALLCETEGRWSLKSQLPLAADVGFAPAERTTEGFIVAPNQARCLTLPLYLPEWKRQQSTALPAGSLSLEEEDLVAHVEGSTNRLYAPLMVSLCDAYAKQPFTWRRLTVGDELRIVGSNEASAYRFQLGQEQWVVYRSLAPAVRRTALGMHTLADFFIGRFDADAGDVDTIVEVEAQDS